MQTLFRLTFVLMLALAACDDWPPLPGEQKEAANTPPSAPVVALTAAPEGDWVRVSVSMASPSTDAEGDTVNYRYAWYRDGVLQLFPLSQNSVTEPAKAQAAQVTWSVAVTPYDDQADGESGSADLVLQYCLPRSVLSNGALQFDATCQDSLAFLAPVTQSVSAFSSSAAKETFIRDVLRDHLQMLSGDATKKARFTNFIDALFKVVFDADAQSPVTFETSAYRAFGYDALQLQDRQCVAAGLATPCLNGYLADNDNDSLGQLFAYAVSQTTYEITQADLNFRIAVEIFVPEVDLLWEPPLDPGLTDVTDASAADRSQDLSSYLKATGTAKLEKIRLEFYVDTAVTSATMLPFQLLSLTVYPSASLTLQGGPYCNNNLGTVGTGLDALLRPFDGAGLPNYAGLVSDTASNTNPDAPLSAYYSVLLGTYPPAGSSISGSIGNYEGGGSGAGRDRVGLAASPYAYGLSDNPNNCRRPADACSSASPLQHGGPDAPGGCELPNVSNDSDDATYVVSEAVVTDPAAVEAVLQHSLLRFPAP